MLAGAGLMGGVIYGASQWWVLPGQWGMQTIRVLVICAIGAAFYAIWSIVMGMDELRWIGARSTERAGTTDGNDGADNDETHHSA